MACASGEEELKFLHHAGLSTITVSEFAMLKRFFKMWRWLLALLFGVVSWYFVDWYLSPKPWYKATFPIITKEPADSRNSVDFAFLRKAHARVFDRDGLYLFVESQVTDSLNQYQLIDLANRKVVAKHLLDPKAIPPSLNLEGLDFARLGYHYAHGTRYQFVLQNSIWEWDAVQNTFKPLQSFPKESYLEISDDGSTLLEVEQVTPLIPTFLQPPGLTSILGGGAQGIAQTSDVVMVRIWSLPGVQQRSAFVFPWMYRGNNFNLSQDGHYLIINDATLLSGFVSPTKETINSVHGIFEHYLRHPIGIKIFDTHSGKIWWEKSEYAGICFLSNESPLVPHFLSFTRAKLEQGERSPRVEYFSLVLPTKQVLASQNVLSESLVKSDIVHFTTEDDSANRQNGSFKVYELNLALQQDPILCFSSLETPYPLHHGSQVVILQSYYYSQYVPDWLSTFLSKSKTVSEWLRKEQENLVIYDYRAQRTLWRSRYDRNVAPGNSFSQQWFCHHLHDTSRNLIHIEVYRLPFASWSPWWGPSTGLFAVFLLRYLLRQRRSKIASHKI